MNKIVTGIKGLMPFYQEDIEFLQQSIVDIAKALASVWGDNFVLSGCKHTDKAGGADITEGWLVVNGEVVYFPAQSPTWFNQFKVKVEDSFTEEREFEIADDSGIKKHKIWNFRKARAIEVSEFDDSDTIELTFKANEKIDEMYSRLVKLANPSTVFNASISGDYDIRFYKEISDRIFGYIALKSAKNYELSFDFPSGIMPSGTTILFENSNGYVKFIESFDNVTKKWSYKLVINYDNTSGSGNLNIPVNYCVA